MVKEQRWLAWKNIDTTPCPPFGIVELVSYQIIGTTPVLLGRSASGFGKEPSFIVTVDINGDLGIQRLARTDQGIQWNHVFNNETSVQPDEIGLCTFDNPSWAATSDPPKIQNSFGFTLTCGNFFAPLALIQLIPEGFVGRFRLLGTPACVPIGEPWKLGSSEIAGVIPPLLLNGEAGYNLFRAEYSPDTPGRSRALVGGLRTIFRSSTYQLGLTIKSSDIFGNKWGPEWETQ